ncbi:MAG: hypothetical protein JXQ72_10210 [Anaerolineae bacterium]|nr:hypothetical protein [Anaerolineae bacterium]
MIRAATARRRDLFLVALLALLAGLLLTFQVYRYGCGDQLTQIPLVKRFIDGGYLPQDFFTNRVAEFSPHEGYAALLVWPARIIGLPAVYLLGTLLSNTTTALITGLAARDLFGTGAGLLAIPLLLSGTVIRLGINSAVITGGSLIPQQLAMPFCLLAIWAAVRGCPLFCAGAAVIGAVIHPLAGLGVGAIGLAAMGGRLVVFERDHVRGWLGRMGAAAVLIGIMTVIWLVQFPPPGDRISTDRFIAIMAGFRLPHHHLPSVFPRRDYVDAAWIVLAGGAAWWYIRFTSQGVGALLAAPRSRETGRGKQRPYHIHSRPDRLQDGQGLTIALIAALVGGLCLIGYVFVELIPVRLVVTAQTFRFLFVLNWLVMLLVGGALAAYLESRERLDRYVVIGLLLAAVSPALLGIFHALIAIQRWMARRIRHTSTISAALTAVMAVLSVMHYTTDHMTRRAYMLVAGFALVFIFLERCPTLRRTRAAGIAYGLVIAFALVGLLWPENALGVVGEILFDNPVITLADWDTPEAEVSHWAHDRTPPDAVFLTPPEFGLFRLIAERAIVVDYKAFLFYDVGMVEWQQRLFDCYGKPDTNGFAAAAELDAAYYHITDAKIAALRDPYSVTYAVLYLDTVTDYPVLFTTGTFQVVDVGPGSSAK